VGENVVSDLNRNIANHSREWRGQVVVIEFALLRSHAPAVADSQSAFEFLKA